MKCVKNNLTSEVKRLSNEQAENRVATLDKSCEANGIMLWSYCPKSEWKALRVAPVVAIVHTDDQKREIQRKADKRKHSADKRSYRKQ